MSRFTAVTYNVLAQSYAHRDRYPLSSPEALDPDRRQALLVERIEALDADLLCLQEVEPTVYSVLSARLDGTHQGWYIQRTPRPEGVAILARRSVFDWHEPRVLHFAAHRTGVDDLALIAALTVDGTPLHVACAHLPWRPDDTPITEHTGCQQMEELLDFRDATAPTDSWIFAGDFNAEAGGMVLTIAHERGMLDSCEKQHPRDTAAISGRTRKIDYLLYSAGRLDPHPGVLPELSGDTVMPSLTEPSDHLPLRVDFAPV